MEELTGCWAGIQETPSIGEIFSLVSKLFLSQGERKRPRLAAWASLWGLPPPPPLLPLLLPWLKASALHHGNVASLLSHPPGWKSSSLQCLRLALTLGGTEALTEIRQLRTTFRLLQREVVSGSMSWCFQTWIGNSFGSSSTRKS